MLLNGYICRLRAASTCKLHSATLPPPNLVIFLSVRSDQNRLSCKTREQNLSLSHLENCIGSKPHQTAQPPGCRRKVSSDVTSFCASPGALPKRPTNQPTNGSNELICSVDRSGHRCRLFWRCCRSNGTNHTAPGPAQRYSVLRSRGALRWL